MSVSPPTGEKQNNLEFPRENNIRRKVGLAGRAPWEIGGAFSEFLRAGAPPIRGCSRCQPCSSKCQSTQCSHTIIPQAEGAKPEGGWSAFAARTGVRNLSVPISHVSRPPFAVAQSRKHSQSTLYGCGGHARCSIQRSGS